MMLLRFSLYEMDPNADKQKVSCNKPEGQQILKQQGSTGLKTQVRNTSERGE